METELTPRNKVRLLAIGAALSFTSIFQMGYASAYPNTAIDGFKDFLNASFTNYGVTFTDGRFSWIWSALLDTWFVGFSIGSCLAVPLADKFGRKRGLLIGNMLNVVSAGLSTVGVVVSSLVLFSLSRLLFSLSAALSMNCLILLLQESSPVAMRGVMSFYGEMSFVATNAIGGLAGMKMMLGTNLVLLTGVSVVVAVISVLVVLPVAESPRFLLDKRKNPKKAASAIFFYQKIQPSQVLDCDESSKAQDSGDGSILALISVPHLRRGFLLGLCALQIAVSIWPIVFFSTDLLRRSGISADASELASTTMLIASTICTCAGMFLVERVGRRTLFISCSVVNLGALCLFVACAELRLRAPGLSSGCIAAVVLHGCSYSVALGPIAWFIVPELMPLPFRALAQSLALAANQALALLLVSVTLPLYDRIGACSLLVLFVAPGAFCLVAIARALPETRGRAIDDIVAELTTHSTSVVVVVAPGEPSCASTQL